MSGPSGPEKKGVRWNEPNLAENEIIRAEIRQRCVRIDEPKTPYHHGTHEHELGEGGEDEYVDERLGGQRRRSGESAASVCRGARGSPTVEDKKRERDKDGEANETDVDSCVHDVPRDPRLLRTAFDEVMEAREQEEEEQEERRAEKKKAFEAARRRHYGNVGLGMRLGGLLKDEEEESDEEGP